MYEATFELAPEAMALIDIDRALVVKGNARARQLLQAEKGSDWPEPPLYSLFPKFQPDGSLSRSHVARVFETALDGRTQILSCWLKDLTGRIFPSEVRLVKLPVSGRELLQATIRDVSEQYREETLRSGENKILASISSPTPLADVLDQINQLVEEVVARSISSIVLVSEDGGYMIHGSAPYLPDEYNQVVDGTAVGPAVGSCGTAIFRRERVVVTDIRSDPLWADYQELAELARVRACWSTPVIAADGRVLASFAVYFREPKSPTADELALLDRLGHLVRIAIERVRSAEALQRSVTLYEATFEQAGVGISHLSTDGRWLHSNQKMREITGFDDAELLAKHIQEITHSDDTPALLDALATLARKPQTRYHAEIRCYKKTGETVWVNLALTPISSLDGQSAHYICVMEDISEQHRLSEQLSYQASHDAVTGLINRYEFENRLRKILQNASAAPNQAALCYLDLDQFKLVNDTVGHIAGDELLRQLSRELTQIIPGSATLARLGGDEFGVILRDYPLNEAVELAEQLRETVAEFRFNWDSKNFRLGASIGVVAISEPEFTSVTDVLRAADAACYTAKDQGRNRVCVYRSDDSDIFQRHGEMEWVQRLTRALDHNLFVLEAQPIVTTDQPSGDPHHYELLIRLRDGNDLIPPGAFLPAAERYAMSPHIDRWVLNNALNWLERYPHAIPLSGFMTINLSGVTVGDPRFHDFLRDAMRERIQLARKICFEITETAAISNLAIATQLIDALRKLGCSFALDDFGSGLSSFGYLKTLPVDYLKIDGLFVKDIGDDPLDRAIVRSINEIGHVMGKKTIAEFVESAEILNHLQQIGVDYAQGYHTGRPKPLIQLAPAEHRNR
ncbi:MAG: EAL domain-containing protein [Pseudomonadota bacterium]|nr:EAL domain-containing protein [Pseudomonadota bacterium]